MRAPFPSEIPLRAPVPRATATVAARPLYRVCVEHLDPRELARPEVVRLLVQRSIAPMLAINFDRGGDPEPALRALRPYLDAGLPACAWPLLRDADGYWPGIANAFAFHRRIDEILVAADRLALRLPWVAFDLEPSLSTVGHASRSIWRFGWDLLRDDVRAGRAAFERAEQEYAALHKKLQQRGTRVVAIAYPPAAADFTTASSSALSRVVAAPLRCGWDRVAVMTYGSLLSGWSGGLLTVEDARYYAFRAVSEMSAALGARAGVFIGLCGPGKLGDEPAYDDPDELRRDAMAARAAGAGEISLFCLEGALHRSNPEAWLDALITDESFAPPFRARGELVHRSMTFCCGALSLLGRG